MSINRKLVTAAVLLVLTGCEAQQQAAKRAEAKAGRAQCDATIPKIQGNFVKHAACVNDVEGRAGFTSPAQELLNAKRMELSERADRGEITPAEAQSEFAETVYRIQQDASAQRAANAQAAAAVLGAMPRPTAPPPLVPYQMPVRQPWTANCYSSGSFTNCSGN